MHSWAAEEFGRAQFGDQRLTKRLVGIGGALAAQPAESVPQASGSWAATKATYRFWDSTSVTPEAIRAAHQQRTIERMQDQEILLVVQDTTDLDWTKHRATTGLGPLQQEHLRGLKVHSTLILTREGVPLGVLAQEVWARDPHVIGKRQQRRKRATAEKESQRWLNSVQELERFAPKTSMVVSVADREADIYDLFALPRPWTHHLLIRGTHNRRVSQPDSASHEPGEAHYLWTSIQSQPCGGTVRVEVPRAPQRPARQATLTLLWQRLLMHPPRHHKHRAQCQPIAVHVVLAEELEPPEETEPICWLLLTPLPVETLGQASQSVSWYSLRWRIEQHHFVLKSGCRIEDLQLETAGRLQRALATYCVVAWRLLWLTYQARVTPQASCELVLQPHEWHALACTHQGTPIPPSASPSLAEAIEWIARLGGLPSTSQ